MRKLAIAASVATLLLLLLWPIKAVWVGEFPLTITIDSHIPIDSTSMLVATCRNEQEVVHLVENPHLYDDTFRRVRELSSGGLVVGIPCSGHDRLFGLFSTYNHPKFIVVEYRSNDGGREKRSHKGFAIPEGRGPRKMTVNVP